MINFTTDRFIFIRVISICTILTDTNIVTTISAIINFTTSSIICINKVSGGTISTYSLINNALVTIIYCTS
jgi:hypothetical protein